ncbi:MAG: hypothetical protein Q9227_000938 [Pyrenula ochraceoflavens]
MKTHSIPITATALTLFAALAAASPQPVAGLEPSGPIPYFSMISEATQACAQNALAGQDHYMIAYQCGFYNLPKPTSNANFAPGSLTQTIHTTYSMSINPDGSSMTVPEGEPTTTTFESGSSMPWWRCPCTTDGNDNVVPLPTPADGS